MNIVNQYYEIVRITPNNEEFCDGIDHDYETALREWQKYREDSFYKNIKDQIYLVKVERCIIRPHRLSEELSEKRIITI